MTAVGLAAVAAACGTTELPTRSTFDGNWSVAELAVDGDAVSLANQPIEIDIDTGEAAFRGQTTCQPLFGSYTFEEATGNAANSGDASITIPSPRASDSCAPADQATHDQVVAALEMVTTWSREGSTLVLSAPSGTLVLLESQAG